MATRSTKPLNRINPLRFYPVQEGTVIADLPVSCETPKTHNPVNLIMEGFSIRWTCNDAYRYAIVMRSNNPSNGFEVVSKVVYSDQYFFRLSDGDYTPSFKVILVFENGDREESNTVGYSQTVNVSSLVPSGASSVTSSTSVRFSSDGRIAYYKSAATTISSAFLKSPFVFDDRISWNSLSVSAQEPTNFLNLNISPCGVHLFIIGNLTDEIHHYTLSTPWDISTATFVDQKDISGQETNGSDLCFSWDGLKMYVVGYGGDEVNEYTLTASWDVSTSSAIATLDLSSYDTDPISFTFSSDFTRLYVLGSTGNTIEVFKNEGDDISEAEYVETIALSSSNLLGITLTPTGTFIINDNSVITTY